MAPDEAPDLFADGMQLNVSPFTVILSFTMNPPGQTGTMPPIRVANIRTSLEHAKVMAIVLQKQIKAYEEHLGQPIPLPPQVWQQLGLSRQEDW